MTLQRINMHVQWKKTYLYYIVTVRFYTEVNNTAASFQLNLIYNNKVEMSYTLKGIKEFHSSKI